MAALEFTGDFTNGSVIIIDLEKKTVKLNGSFVYTFDGDFFELAIGAKGITYTDDESSRSVACSITHKDRWA